MKLSNPAVRLLKKAKQLNGHENQIKIVPYLINLIALKFILEDEKYFDDVKDYMKWYLSKINTSDIHGLSGTIYDYKITENEEIPLNTYDSVDGYASTFLLLVYFYSIKTGNLKFALKNLKKLKDIAYVISYLQDKDGLIKALPDKNIKYLIDNIEALYGLKSFTCLLYFSGDKDWEYYRSITISLEKAVNREFVYHGNIIWAKDNIFHKIGSKVYPDLYAKAVFMTYKNRKIPSLWIGYFDIYQNILLKTLKIAGKYPCFRTKF